MLPLSSVVIKGGGVRAALSLSRLHPLPAHCVHCRHQTKKRSDIRKKKKRDGAREQQVGMT